MPVTLIKISAPGWEKELPDVASAAIELRRHICKGCLAGDPECDESGLDREVDGTVVECHDLNALLATSCGFEFYIEEENEVASQDD